MIVVDPHNIAVYCIEGYLNRELAIHLLVGFPVAIFEGDHGVLVV